MEVLLEAIQTHGPWVLFLLAVGETSFVTGLVVPSGVATSAATILALEGHLSLPGVLAAALAGGWVGDHVGFWIGRRGRAWLVSGGGRLVVVFRRRRADDARVFTRHPLVSVTGARLVSFVRTVMPMAAGMSELSYARYLVFEAAGVTLWVALYALGGVVASRGWQALSATFGVWVAALVSVLLLLAWAAHRSRSATGARGP